MLITETIGKRGRWLPGGRQVKLGPVIRVERDQLGPTFTIRVGAEGDEYSSYRGEPWSREATTEWYEVNKEGVTRRQS